jgi:hypothetical protein
VRGEFSKEQNNAKKKYTPKQRKQRRMHENKSDYMDQEIGNVK